MTKTELINAIIAGAGITKQQAKDALSALETHQVRAAKRCEEVLIPGLGKVKTVDFEAREGKNPKTGEPVNVPARRRLKFRASVTLAREIKAEFMAQRGETE